MAVGIAAFAVEDRVDFRFSEITLDRRSPEQLAWDLFAKDEDSLVESRGENNRTADILGKVLNDRPGQRDFIFRKRIVGDDYFGAVEAAISEALHRLDAAFPVGPVHGKRDAIDSIEALVVSTAGVVTNAETLVQLPLWSFEPQESVEWTDKGGEFHSGFNFAEVITKHADEANGKTNTYLRNNIFVVNDAVASAAYVYSQEFIADIDKPEDEQRRVAFLKVHNGVNAALIVEESFTRRSTHPEFGHFYPIIHPTDLKNGFSGTCPFHLSCAEGMLSRRSLLSRAQADHPWKPIVSWEKQISGENEGEQERAMFKSKIRWDAEPEVMPPPGENTDDAVDLVSFYIAQLLYQLLASPLVPDVVVVGGAYATEAVVAASRQRVLELARGYPSTIFGKRNAGAKLAHPGDVLLSKVKKAKAPNIRHIELNGALFIGMRRLAESTRGNDVVDTAVGSPEESHNP